MSTPQAALWAGEFGTEWTKRHTANPAQLRTFFGRALSAIAPVMDEVPHTVMEFGANEGHNLRAIRDCWSKTKTYGVEINRDAFGALQNVADAAWNQSFLDTSVWPLADLAFTRGVLIHVAPRDLGHAYHALYEASLRYIMIAEYYSPRTREIHYRGNDNALWARDFGGDMLDLYPTLRLLDYGFAWDRDEAVSQDNVTWWLFEKDWPPTPA